MMILIIERIINILERKENADLEERIIEQLFPG